MRTQDSTSGNCVHPPKIDWATKRSPQQWIVRITYLQIAKRWRTAPGASSFIRNTLLSPESAHEQIASMRQEGVATPNAEFLMALIVVLEGWPALSVISMFGAGLLVWTATTRIFGEILPKLLAG